MSSSNTIRPQQAAGRQDMADWQEAISQNVYTCNPDLPHSVAYWFGANATRLHENLEQLGARVAQELEPLVAENDFRGNMPRLENWDGIGRQQSQVAHHPNYIQAGNIIYGSGMMARMAKAGGLAESLAQFLLTSHAGEAGHNCPVACTAGVIRVLEKSDGSLPEDQRQHYLQRLLDPSYETNFTGAQFVTEVQGGSDVGRNDTLAVRNEDGSWNLTGEKWFCSNAHAELILMTARYDVATDGTSGLGLFLVPATLPDGSRNHYRIRRLKEKLGTRTMASGEIDFEGAVGWAMGPVEEGFKMLMQNVLHISRIYNTFATVGLGRRAYQVASEYTRHRIAFDAPVIRYPLVQENLATIKAESNALTASAFALAHLQDDLDTGKRTDPDFVLLLRLLANLNKYISALWSVEHAHHCIDMLAGNGTIETFSPLPRLLRDSLVCENWEGTHNTLRMQVLRDIHKFNIHEILFDYMGHILPSEASWATPLRAEIDHIDHLIQTMQSSSMELQSLQIKDAVHRMAIVFAAAQLGREADHQRETTGDTSKEDCLRLLIGLHCGTERMALATEDGLRLMRSVLSHELER